MKKFLLTVVGNFETEQDCKDVAIIVTPVVDSPHLKFQQSKGALIFHFASDIDQDELYEYFVINFLEISSCFILTEYTDNVSVYLPPHLKEHLFDLETAGEQTELLINLHENDEDLFNVEEQNDFVALLLEDVKKKIKKPTLDQLLEKIHKKGQDSLSQFEKDTLDYYSKN